MLRHRPYLARKNIQGGPDKNPPQITDSKNIRPDKKPPESKGLPWGVLSGKIFFAESENYKTKYGS